MLEMEGRIRGLNLERLMQEARKAGIALRDVRKEKTGGVAVRCARKDYGRLRALAEEKGYDMEPGRPAGLFRRVAPLRWGVAAGLLLGMLLAAPAFSFVWAVEVRNAGAYEADARAYLEEIGIRPGILRSRVSLAGLRETLEWRWPRVQWVRTEWAGTALRITLEEGTPPAEIEPAGRTGDVVAAEDGLLTRLTVYAGTPAARAGEFVRAGQVLIRGGERRGEGVEEPVKARGEALARVWVSARARLPLLEDQTLPTGQAYIRTVIGTPAGDVCFRDTPEYLTWDLERETAPLGGAWLPLTACRETYREAAVVREPRDAEEVKKEGAEAALKLLDGLIREDETVDKWINFCMIEGDTILTEATAEVKRDIGRFQPR